MADPKQPAKWATMDPNEQWQAALTESRKALDAENYAWKRQTEETIRAREQNSAKEDYNRTELRWSRFLWSLAILAAGAVLALIVWSIYSYSTNTTISDLREQQDTSQWVDDCVTNGGQVVRDASDGLPTSSGLRLCVKDGTVVGSHEIVGKR